MDRFTGDRCPKCGEERDLEYGNAYAEDGTAWHGITCLKCKTYYIATYRFEGVEVFEYGDEEE